MDKIPPKKQYIVRRVGQNFEGAVVEIKGRKELSHRERVREKSMVTCNQEEHISTRDWSTFLAVSEPSRKGKLKTGHDHGSYLYIKV